MNYDIVSTQSGTHPNLVKTIKKHQTHHFKAPIAQHNQQAFTQLAHFIDPSRPMILDSGCGNGMSSHILAQQNPHHQIIAIDKSLHRLSHQHPLKNGICQIDTIFFVRANLIDFWRLCVAAQWHFQQHCIFYPNPWPKPKHLMRRFHAHPIFSDMLSLSGRLQIRSNWDIYLYECQQAIETLTQKRPKVQKIQPIQAISHFEKKYLAAGQPLFELEHQCA